MALRPADRYATVAAAAVGGLGVVAQRLVATTVAPAFYWPFLAQYLVEGVGLALGVWVASRVGARGDSGDPRSVARTFGVAGLLGASIGPLALVVTRPTGLPLADSLAAAALPVVRFVPAFVLAGLAGVPLGAAGAAGTGAEVKEPGAEEDPAGAEGSR